MGASLHGIIYDLRVVGSQRPFVSGIILPKNAEAGIYTGDSVAIVFAGDSRGEQTGSDEAGPDNGGREGESARSVPKARDASSRPSTVHLEGMPQSPCRPRGISETDLLLEVDRQRLSSRNAASG
jgi:hypothetical protein